MIKTRTRTVSRARGHSRRFTFIRTTRLSHLSTMDVQRQQGPMPRIGRVQRTVPCTRISSANKARIDATQGANGYVPTTPSSWRAWCDADPCATTSCGCDSAVQTQSDIERHPEVAERWISFPSRLSHAPGSDGRHLLSLHHEPDVIMRNHRTRPGESQRNLPSR